MALPYNHGVTVSEDGVLTAAIETVHGQPEKPTIALSGSLSIRVVRKQREMRFGACELERYRALDYGGKSWFSEECIDIVTYLCCYAGGTAKLYNGNQKMETFGLNVDEGDVVSVKSQDGEVHFSVNGSHIVSCPAPGAGLGRTPHLAVQFHTTDDAVKFEGIPVLYNHGVTVGEDGVLTAAIETVHGQPEKPTIGLLGSLSVRVVRKQREMRFGACVLERYRALDYGGKSWFSEGCIDIVTYLCCYAGGVAVLYNGNQKMETFGLNVDEGDVVSVKSQDGEVHFSVNGSHIVSCPAPGAGLGRTPHLAVQFHTTDDAVKFERIPVLYNHGVTVGEDGVLTAAIETVHGQPEKPTIGLLGSLSVRVVRKQREMRFGACVLERYRALDYGGKSWFSAECIDVVTYLCCYAGGSSALYNGNKTIKKFNLDVGEGDIVGAKCENGKIHFSVNGSHIVSCPEPDCRGPFDLTLAVQFHTMDDVVKIEGGSTVQAPAPAPTRTKKWGDGIDAPNAGLRNFFPDGFELQLEVPDAISQYGHSASHVAKIMDAGRKKASTSPHPLANEHAAAMYAYTEETHLYSELNRAMRTPGSDLARHVDYIFHLQSGLSSLLSHVSERQGLVYRGITALLNPEIYAVGKVITWQAFSSSTKAQLAALGFVSELPGSRLRGSMFVIQSVTAKDIRHFSAIPSEEEVLFPPNSQFKVETVATNEAEKKGLLDQLDAYDMTDLDVYTLKQIG